jgi:hypothetical protein
MDAPLTCPSPAALHVLAPSLGIMATEVMVFPHSIESTGYQRRVQMLQGPRQPHLPTMLTAPEEQVQH